MRQQMLLRIRTAPECKSALQRLAGEVLQIRITGLTEYRLAFRDGGVELDPEAEPTIFAEGSVEVIDAILAGKLDPLAAILTRRLKAKMDPVRGPLLRTILRAGIRGESHDMGWDRVIGKLPSAATTTR
jgi:putative sterol carrier protein